MSRRCCRRRRRRRRLAVVLPGTDMFCKGDDLLRSSLYLLPEKELRWRMRVGLWEMRLRLLLRVGVNARVRHSGCSLRGVR